MISANRIRRACASGGIDALAVMEIPRTPLPSGGLDAMLADGVGDMHYMKRHRELRLNPRLFLEGGRSVLIAAMHYSPQLEQRLEPCLRRARYAMGKDYHKIFRKALIAVGRELFGDGGAAFRVSVDSTPVLERTLARMSGIGWLGKNGLMLIPQRGSYFFLGFLFSSEQMEIIEPEKGADRCGTCQRCEQACPTDAIAGDRRVISERCISYLTIEHRQVIKKELAEKMNGWWFGCDICQQVCPWNRFAPEPGESRFLGADSEKDLLELTESNFDGYFAGRAVRRINFEQFRRNLLAALFSQGRVELAGRIVQQTPLPLVEEQARELQL